MQRGNCDSSPFDAAFRMRRRSFYCTQPHSGPVLNGLNNRVSGRKSDNNLFRSLTWCSDEGSESYS